MKRNEDSLWGLCDNIKQTNICILGVPEEEEREKSRQYVFKKIMAVGFHSGSVAKNPPANTGDTGSIPNPEKYHMLWNN